MAKTNIKFYLKVIFVIFVVAVSCMAVGCDESNKQDTTNNDEVTSTIYENKIVDGVAYWYNDNNERITLNDQFVEYKNESYYIVNNKVVTGYYLIDKTMYNFANNGVQNKAPINNIFVEINKNTYYVINNVIVTGYQLIDNEILYFDNNGVLDKKPINNIFVEINNNTYYVVNNIAVTGFQLIGDEIRHFDQYGVMDKEPINNVFVKINNTIYYVVNNLITTGYQFIGNEVHYFDKNGMDKEPVNNAIVEINNNTYYIVNNVVATGYQLIGNEIYYFDQDGVMDKNPINNVFVEINNNTYYVINNIIATGYQFIDKEIHHFDQNGVMDKEPINNIFVEINNNTYYVINNIAVTGYYLIDERMYYFGDDGVQSKENITNVFITINNNTYYVINNIIIGGYVFIENSIYRFDNETKIMYTNQEIDGYRFDEYGKIYNYDTTTFVYVTINENIYFIGGCTAYECNKLDGKIIVSDADDNINNNEVLSNALVTVDFNGYKFTVYTDSEGKFVFDVIPTAVGNITVEKSGYITVETDTANLNANNGLMVADQYASNNLNGIIFIADSDLNNNNNSTLSGATITLERISSTNIWIKTTTSNTNGSYSFTELTAGAYIMTVSHPDYKTLTQTVYVHYNQTTLQNMALEMIAKCDETVTGNASGQVINASTGEGVPNLTIYVYEGVNTISEEVVCTTKTTSNGNYTLSDLVPGNYTLKIVDETELTDERYRFGNSVFSIKVLANTTVSNQNTTVSNASAINAESLRIVLTWGATPSDLDSHLVISGTTSAHVYYSNKSQDNAALDVDDTTSYGPETITITSLKENCVYKYYVHVYTSGATFANSNAMVRVYLGNSTVPYYTFYVPAENGIYWTIFTYDTTTNTFTIIDQVSNSVL